MQTYIPTLNGDWVNLKKIIFFTIGSYNEDNSFYIVAVTETSEKSDLSRWVLSKHANAEDARKCLDNFIYNMCPTPNLDIHDGYFEPYEEVATRLYYVSDKSNKCEIN